MHTKTTTSRRASVASQSFFRLGDIHDKYIVGEVIGRGNHAEVRLGQNRETSEKVAIKTLSLTKEVTSDILNEIDIMARVEDHPHVIKLKEIYEKGNFLYIVMELVRGGELFDRVLEQQSFDESCVRDLMFVLLQTIDHMHSCGVVHRDLKPENILFATRDPNSPIKIADFGLAKLTHPTDDQDIMKTFCGTPGYVAPEVLKNSKGYYTSQCDMWSIGVILYIVLCGYPPFQHDQQAKLFKQILKADYKFHSPWWDKVSNEGKDLVKKLLVVNPKRRLTAKQALSHPFLTGAKFGPAVDVDALNDYTHRLYERKFRTITNTLLFAQKLNGPSELGRTRSRVVDIDSLSQSGSESESDVSVSPPPSLSDVRTTSCSERKSFFRAVAKRLSN